jgi:hypothetical protein
MNGVQDCKLLKMFGRPVTTVSGHYSQLVWHDGVRYVSEFRISLVIDKMFLRVKREGGRPAKVHCIYAVKARTAKRRNLDVLDQY